MWFDNLHERLFGNECGDPEFTYMFIAPLCTPSKRGYRKNGALPGKRSPASSLDVKAENQNKFIESFNSFTEPFYVIHSEDGNTEIGSNTELSEKQKEFIEIFKRNFSKNNEIEAYSKVLTLVYDFNKTDDEYARASSKMPISYFMNFFVDADKTWEDINVLALVKMYKFHFEVIFTEDEIIEKTELLSENLEKIEQSGIESLEKINYFKEILSLVDNSQKLAFLTLFHLIYDARLDRKLCRRKDGKYIETVVRFCGGASNSVVKAAPESIKIPKALYEELCIYLLNNIGEEASLETLIKLHNFNDQNGINTFSDDFLKAFEKTFGKITVLELTKGNDDNASVFLELKKSYKR